MHKGDVPFVSFSETVLDDMQQCCQRGMMPFARHARSLEGCRHAAAGLTSATLECTNTFFKCCQRAALAATNKTRSEGTEARLDWISCWNHYANAPVPVKDEARSCHIVGHTNDVTGGVATKHKVHLIYVSMIWRDIYDGYLHVGCCKALPDSAREQVLLLITLAR